MADKISASTAPGPTVTPMACSTGTVEVASAPKPITVVALATASDASVRGAIAPAARLSLSKNSA